MMLFGSKKKDPALPQPAAAPGPTDSNSAMTKLRDTAETLEKRKEHLQRKVEHEVKSALEHSKKNKKKEAIMCIKKKKMYEKQIEQLENTLITLTTQQLALESMTLNREALEATKVANAALKANVKAMGGVDAVAETIDEVEDGLQDADEIQQELGRAVGMPGIDDDEDDLLAELEGLEETALTEEISKVDISSTNQSAVDQMPGAPTNELLSLPAAGTAKVSSSAGMTEEERELAELEASMAM